MLRVAILTTAAGVLMTLPVSLPSIGAGMIVMTAGSSRRIRWRAGGSAARRPIAPAQASALYLCLYYIGSSIAGSAGGVFYARGGWPGTVIFVLALLAIALVNAASLGTAADDSRRAGNKDLSRSSVQSRPA